MKGIKLIKPVRGFSRHQSGVITVARSLNPTAPYRAATQIPDYLSLVDHSVKLSQKEYKKALRQAESEFNELARQLKENGLFLIGVFMGRDGSGKSGACERVREAVYNDNRLIKVISFAQPSDEEIGHPYLWKYNKYDYIPSIGQVRLNDRGWPERVMVERVDEITADEKINDSYSELNTHAWLLHRQGGIIVQFWMDITKDEQEKRFEDRKKDKPEKYSESDAKARKKWPQYTVAANEWIHRCGTKWAPIHIISSEDKRYSRVTVLRSLNQAMKQRIAEVKAAKKK